MSDFLSTVEKRRSIYAISSEMPITDECLKEALARVLVATPTAYNMQSGTLVLLLGAQHQHLWRITLETLKTVTPPKAFPRTQQKIAAFAAGHGTILFFDDTAVTHQFMADNPLFSANFPPWALQQNGMLQFAVWGMLAQHHVGASLQHYNPLIDDEIKQLWGLPASWQLLAQMPFGGIILSADSKDKQPAENRMRVFE